MGLGVSIAVVALGATVIGKYFTLSCAEGGVLSAFSLGATELAALVQESERAWQVLCKVRYGGHHGRRKGLALVALSMWPEILQSGNHLPR